MTKPSHDPLYRSAVVLQIVIAIVVTAAILMIEVIVYGSDIDGRSPPLRDFVEDFGIEGAIIAAYVCSAILLKRGKRTGWWISMTLDIILCFSAGYYVLADINERLTVPAFVYRDDLLVHGLVMLLPVAAIVVLTASFRSKSSLATPL